jgi:hypothetical protein
MYLKKAPVALDSGTSNSLYPMANEKFKISVSIPVTA